MNLFTFYKGHLGQALKNLQSQKMLEEGLDLSKAVVEPPRDPSHGDLSTNAALIFSKNTSLDRQELAQKIIEEIQGWPHVVSAQTAGPGFINIVLDHAIWQEQILTILKEGVDYGSSSLGQGKDPVNIEFVSANPTGPLHVAHARGAIVGDSTAALLEKIGYPVIREYYINDSGSQVDTLARSTHLRYRELFGEEIKIPEGHYPGLYLVDVAQELKEQEGDRFLNTSEEEWMAFLKPFAVSSLMKGIKTDLESLGIFMEVFSSEKKLVDAGKVEEALKTLEAQDNIYNGVLAAPKGKKLEGWEEREQKLFRSSSFGDDVDRPVEKSDGSYTYFASDIAYHYDKIQRGSKSLIDVLGADHAGYVKRIQAAVKALTQGQGQLDVQLIQLVTLLRDGSPVKMSKRSGDFVSVADVVNEVGKDVLRFTMLLRKADMAIDFDFDKVLEQSRENPVFYVQYTHARCCSVLRQAAAKNHKISIENQQTLSLLNAPEELDLLKKLASWPRVVETAALSREPHKVVFFLLELASSFNSLWNRGNESPELRFLQDDPSITQARLLMVTAIRTVIASALNVIGVTPVEELKSDGR